MTHFLKYGCMAVCVFQYAYAQLTNFGEPNTAHLVRAMVNKSVHIVQLGDSHTAGDTMTDGLRQALQQAMGDGGMGWAMPMYFGGQRMARFGYDNTNFSPISSRGTFDENFSLGGMIAKPKSQGATLTIKPKQSESIQKVLLRLRQSPSDHRFVLTDATGRQVSLELAKKDGSWQFVSVDAKLPFTLYNDNALGSAIAGFWAFSPSGRGAVVSAIGINGSQLSHWNRWNQMAWMNELATIRPSLIVLAYGTNEAHNGVLGGQMQITLTQTVRQIRRASPYSAVMIVSAPESLTSTAGSCGNRPATLSEIQIAQRQVAQNERTLFWDWQSAMGGACTMKSWINRGLANTDGVHFTKLGYLRLGHQMASDLLALSGTAKGQQPIYSPAPINAEPVLQPPTPTSGQGYIWIEKAN